MGYDIALFLLDHFITGIGSCYFDCVLIICGVA